MKLVSYYSHFFIRACDVEDLTAGFDEKTSKHFIKVEKANGKYYTITITDGKHADIIFKRISAAIDKELFTKPKKQIIVDVSDKV